MSKSFDEVVADQAVYDALVERKVDSQAVYDGNLLHVRSDGIVLPNGHEAHREYIVHPGAVAVVALDEQDNAFMVAQYRYPLQDVLLEVPAGKLDPGESPDEAVRREQREETGTIADSYVYMGLHFPTCAYSDEKIHLYVCRVSQVLEELELDEDEFLCVRKVPLAQLEQMVLEDKIQDGKSQVAILKAAAFVRAGRI